MEFLKNIFLFVITNSISVLSDNICCMLSFKIYWDLFYGPAYGLFWWMLQEYTLKRMCILLLLSVVFYIQLNLVDLQIYSIPLYPCWFSLYLFYQTLRNVKISTYNCELVYFSFQFWQSLFLAFWSSLTRCLYIFRIVLSFWSIYSYYYKTVPLYLWYSLCWSLIYLIFI